MVQCRLFDVIVVVGLCRVLGTSLPLIRLGQRGWHREGVGLGEGEGALTVVAKLR